MLLSRRWMATLAAVMLVGVIVSCAGSPNQAPTPTQWSLVWSDEFDGPAGAPVNDAIWTHEVGDGCAIGICGWGNQEKEHYTSSTENAALTGSGQLAITARVAPAGLSCYYGACRYTSARIKTQGKRTAHHGRVEARIKLPVGQGLWPAFWMLGSNITSVPWPHCGELDIMEYRGSRPAETSSAVHGPGYSGGNPFAGAYTLAEGRFADDFHVFAVEWDSLGARFFVDGTAHFALTRDRALQRGAWVFDQPFFVILNIAVGGHFDGDPASDAVLPATMLVDYVRAYQRGTR